MSSREDKSLLPGASKSRLSRLFALAGVLALFALLSLAGEAEPQETTGASEAQYAEPEAGQGAAEDPGGSGDALPPEVALPEVGARAWILTDAVSGEVLAGSEADREVPMASTTKIMTALVTLENADLDEEVRVSPLAASYAVPEYSNAGLREGDVLSVRELLYGTLVVSGGDAAVALAEHVAGETGEQGVDEFVGMMNDEAQRLGLSETRFENPIGLDDRDHHSSARDLARLTREAARSELFDEISATEYATITTQDRTIELTNLNELLYLYPPATGVKTGTTPKAGPSLVGSALDGDEEYIAVVLDDEDRFGSTIRVLDYGFAAYDRRAVVERGEVFEEVQLPFRRDEEVPLAAGQDIEALVDADSRIETEVRVPEDLPAEAAEGDGIGEVVLSLDGEVVGESALVAGRGYEEASVFQKVGFTVSRLWN